MAGEYTGQYRGNAFTAATLAGAGVYAAGASIECGRYNHVAFECSYTRGAVGGAVKVKVELSFDKGTTWIATRTRQLNTGAPGGEVIHDLIAEADRHTSSGAGAETFVVERAQVTATHIRISAAETGVVGTPGTLAAVARLSRNG